MSGRPILGSAIRLGLITLLCAACGGKGTGSGEDDSAALFAAEGIPAFELLLDRGAMAELAREPRDYVRGSFVVRGPGGARYDDVAVRFKGHRSMRSWAGKPAFKLDFDKHVKDRRVFGLAGLVLNNMVEDPTMLRENLGARVYAALGVPAPRAGYAELYVNGERFGLYTVLEPIDEGFLARGFGSGKGPLYEGEYGCDVYEGDVFGMQHDRGEDPGRAHLLAMARAVQGPPSTWLLSDEPVFDRKRLLGFLAASALLGDFDGYRHAHNYRLYRDPKAERWSLIPWGFDRILKRRLSIYDSAGRLARACFDDRGCRLEYVKTLSAAVKQFEALELERTATELAAKIAKIAARDPRKPYDRSKRDVAVAALHAFIRERPAEVRAQIACWDGSREVDRDGDGAGCMDCDDSDPAIHPGATELCDGKDNDCSGQIDDAPSCGCKEVQAGGSTFALCDFPRTWWEARAFCAARGQVLAHVNDRGVAKELARAADAVRESEFWIGLSDLEREGHYRFEDGTRVSRALWAKGEPDPHACGEHCAALKERGRGKLRDLHCATPLPFVCSAKRDAAATPAAAAEPPPNL